jgi:hypothetical protein
MLVGKPGYPRIPEKHGARMTFRQAIHLYNADRTHMALDMKAPGSGSLGPSKDGILAHVPNIS